MGVEGCRILLGPPDLDRCSYANMLVRERDLRRMWHRNGRVQLPNNFPCRLIGQVALSHSFQ